MFLVSPSPLIIPNMSPTTTLLVDWFGNSTSASAVHHVTEGRFAYQKAYKSDKEGVVTNPYGYMRSPWNTGKSPWVTRVHKFCDVSLSYQSWPSCAEHWNMTFRFECVVCNLNTPIAKNQVLTFVRIHTQRQLRLVVRMGVGKQLHAARAYPLLHWWIRRLRKYGG